ncbi:hypothetical protein, conserved [Eimeria praecox]|uniref:Uncharacterized protein n=1 Tax=Eimeria praecox TaxID=51316 RepID=U6H241_9EIME|nr:hypothetical protein, conserved [Eimeria praecox]
MQEMPTSHGGAGAPHIVPGPIHSPSHEQVLGLQTSFQMPLSMDDSPPSSASPSEIQSRLDENLSGVHDLFQPHAYQQPLGLQTTFNVMPSMGGPTAFHVFPGALQGRSDEHLPGVQGANQPHYTEVGNTIAYPWFESPADRSPLDETEAFDEDAWLEQIPDIVSGQGGGGEAPLGPYVISDSPEGSVSTSSADISPPSDADAMQDDDFDINTHPFVRLPVLEDGVVIRHMEVKDLFKPFRGKVQPYFYLSTLRALFAKSVLDQDDVNKLVNAVEGLIGAAWHQAQRRFRKTRPLYAAEALGKNFLALDAIICAIQLLGDTMSVSTWWDEFISAFNCDPSIYLPPLVRQISVSNRRLIRRLLNVLEIYKKGERPSAEEVYEIKKKLFCSEDAPLHFKDFKWTPWRKDGNCSWK